MKMRNIYAVLFLSVVIFGGCKKYLDKKSDVKLSIPDNLNDIEYLLDNVLALNLAPAVINSASDEYYVSNETWNAADITQRNAYVWNPQTDAFQDWASLYNAILVANTALDNLENIDRAADPGLWDNLKGRGLFSRAYNFFQLTQIYAPNYVGNENSTLGIPLRLNADFNQPVTRATLNESYDQIFADLNAAIQLMPDKNRHNTRGSKWAGYALMARMHLLLGNYQKAYNYADSCLAISSELMDYNSVDGSPAFPFMRTNPEVIFFTKTENSIAGYYWSAMVDSNLYKSFAQKDLRTKLFFIDNPDGTHSFKGNYSDSYSMFNGLATDEIYLTHAEAAVRLGKVAEAQKNLNKLLENRWETGAFTPPNITDQEELLKIILQERRKELINRGIRWSDLRRLNNDSRFTATPKRVLNGTEYTLAPGDPRYVFLIPQSSITISGIAQNPR